MSKTITADELDDVVTAAVGAACFACNAALKDAAFTIRQMESDAALGALVRRIREHEAFKGACIWTPNDGLWHTPHLSDSQLEGCLSHLDSLLPKEPEVVTGESGREYRFQPGFVASVEVRHRNADGVATAWEIVSRVPVMDAPVVAKLMEGAR